MVLIDNWKDLAKQKSEEYYLDINLDYQCGWIRSKYNEDDELYLSTHTFYEGQHIRSNEILQRYGFSVVLESWG